MKKYIVIDTETCPIDNTVETVEATNQWVYDCGWAVVDENGKVYKTQSFVNADIFLNEKIAMKNAFFAEKIPTYWEEIKKGERTLTSWYNIRKALVEDIKMYDVEDVFAHNSKFDYATLNTTQRWITKSKYRWFFPYGIKIGDTLKMSREVLGNDESYKEFCKENNFLTKNGKLRFTAEIVYRFITDDVEFIESHTALEDVLIEKEILKYCLANM